MLWDLAKGFILTKEQSEKDLRHLHAAVLGIRGRGVFFLSNCSWPGARALLHSLLCCYQHSPPQHSASAPWRVFPATCDHFPRPKEGGTARLSQMVMLPCFPSLNPCEQLATVFCLVSTNCTFSGRSAAFHLLAQRPQFPKGRWRERWTLKPGTLSKCTF